MKKEKRNKKMKDFINICEEHDKSGSQIKSIFYNKTANFEKGAEDQFSYRLTPIKAVNNLTLL